MRPSSVIYQIATVFCALVGLYDVIYGVAFYLPDSSVARALPPVMGKVAAAFPDFLSSHGAARGFFEGKLGTVYDPQAFTSFLNELYGRRAHFTSQAFLHPPVWLLMMLPLAVLPVDVAVALFMLATVTAFAIAFRRERWGWVAIFTSPAALWVILSGQSSFLYVVLLYAGLRVARRAPALAGVLLGCLVYEPEVCLLVPIALLASRQWRVFVWMIGTAALLALASAALLGPDMWERYAAMARTIYSSSPIDDWASGYGMRIQISPFYTARLLHLPEVAAASVQIMFTLGAVMTVWLAFRHRAESAARTAVLIAAILVVTPMGTSYDLLLLLPTVVLLFREGARDGFFPLEPPVYALLWLLPTVMLFINQRVPLALPAIALFGFHALLRLLAERPAVYRRED